MNRSRAVTEAIREQGHLYDALKQRCAPYSNVKTVQGDVLLFEPEDRYELVFLGGLLMYLNEGDAVSLLRKLVRCLEPGGVIVCRETTVRQGVVTRVEEYQAVYRSLEVYSRIFSESGLSAVTTQQNTPYVLLQMGCEFVKKWKAWIPKPLQLIPLVGRLAYRALRIGYPWIVRVPGAFRLQYPTLTNHFFVLQPDVSDLQGTSSEGISNQETSSAV